MPPAIDKLAADQALKLMRRAASFLERGGAAALNIGMVTSVLPVSGVPLPFLSAGGSSLVILMVAAGMLVNVARRCEHRGAAPPT